MATKVLIVIDGDFRFDIGSGGFQDFTFKVLVDALTLAGIQVSKANRSPDTTADFQNFTFNGVGINLLEYNAIWMIGRQGRNSVSVIGNSGEGGDINLPPAELKAIARFMDAGGGVFATGDHDSIGSCMCGHIPRVRAARCWYGQGDGASPMSAGFPRNFPVISAARADTTRPNPAGAYNEFPPPFVWFENQSDSVPQAITPVTNPAHSILRRNGNNITVYPDHMHEGQTLGEVPGYDYTQSIMLDGQSFTEFPLVAGDRPKPEIIATGTVPGFQNRSALDGSFTGSDNSVAAPKNVNTLSVYDGRRAGVGRIVTGSTFHHYIDINLTGDSNINNAQRKTRTGPDAEKGHGFAHPGAEQIFADIKAVFVNITNWIARPKPAITLILERSTFGQDEVTLNPQFDNAILVTVDGLKPSQFPDGNAIPVGITTLSPSMAQLASWAPVVSATGLGAIEIVPTSVSSDDPTLPARLQRFTFKYRVRFIADAFGFAGPAQSIPVTAALTSPTALAAPLVDNAWIELVKSANPFMLDLDGVNTTTWLSSDLKVFPVIEGGSVGSETLPNGANRTQALQFIQNLCTSLTPAQFTGLTGNQAASALSPFPTTNTNKKVYNFAVARVRRNGTIAAASNVRVFFRTFTSQTTAALTYNEAMGVPTGGYLKTPGAAPIALPGVSGNAWLSFPFFASTRAAAPAAQIDPDNVKNISVAEHDKFFGVLIDNNLAGAYLPPTPNSAGAAIDLPTLLMGEHQCLVAQIEFAGTPIPSGANPATSDKLAQRNIALSVVANPGIGASRTAMHTFEIEATPHPIADGLPPDELVLECLQDIPDNTWIGIHIPSWNVNEVLELAERFYPRHELRAVDSHKIELPAGGIRYIPIPRSLSRQTGVITVELPLGIKKGQRFDVSIRQITNRSRNARVPQPTIKQISLKEADRLIAELGVVTAPATATARRGSRSNANNMQPRGVFDLGNNRSLVTDLAAFELPNDHALLIEHPDPKEVAAAKRESGMWRETIGAFQLGIPVSMKEDMLLYHLRLLSVMTWRAAHLSRESHWYATFNRYVELLSDKVRALGGDPFAVPATPDGMIPQLPGKEGGKDGGEANGDNGNMHDHGDYCFDPAGDDCWAGADGHEPGATGNPGIWSGKISGLLFDHFGDFEGFTLESRNGTPIRFFSREQAIHNLARSAWLERYVVTVSTASAQSQRIRLLQIGGHAN